MTLDLKPLETAISRLEEALDYCASAAVVGDARATRVSRAGAIQAFEFTYELCWTTLQRHLLATEPSIARVEAIPFPDLIRLGNRRGLLKSEWAVWKDYRARRGATSHTYNENKAAEVFDTLPGFLDDARYLLARLQEGAAAE